MKRKNPLKTILITVLVLAVAAGAAYGAFRYFGSRGGEVSVYPVNQLITSAEWVDAVEMEGGVTTDRIQSVYVSSTQQITEVYVREGDAVQEGDPLLAYDTTLSEVDLARQQIEIRQLELDIANAEKELREISTYRVGTGGGGGGYVDPALPEPDEPIYPPSMPFDRAPAALGTADDPFIFLWNDDCAIGPDFLSEAVDRASVNRTAYSAENGGGAIVLPNPFTGGTTPSGEPEPTASPDSPGSPEPTESDRRKTPTRRTQPGRRKTPTRQIQPDRRKTPTLRTQPGRRPAPIRRIRRSRRRRPRPPGRRSRTTAPNRAMPRPRTNPPNLRPSRMRTATLWTYTARRRSTVSCGRCGRGCGHRRRRRRFSTRSGR